MKRQFTPIAGMLMLTMFTVLFATCKKEMNVALSDENQLLSKATTFTSNEKQPVDEIVFVPCANGGAGENVHLTGTIHILIHTTVNKTNFTTKYHFQPQGLSGTGEITEFKYRGSGVTQEEIKGSLANEKFIDTYINNFKIVSHGVNYKIHDNMHIIVNANGETTATVDNFSSDCK
jgi:hypothetical protein